MATDGPLLAHFKRLVMRVNAAELGLRRALARLRGERPWRLGGACGGCARCCEAPSIQVGRATWYLPTLRWAFLAWQRRVNGFELVRRERPRVFVFRCAHFDPATRRCDSYASRPLMCRDYPKLLLWQPTPELFPECGFRPVHPEAARLRAALEAQDLPEERLRELGQKLFLEEDP